MYSIQVERYQWILESRNQAQDVVEDNGEQVKYAHTCAHTPV